MVTLLFTAIFIVGLLAITLYFWVPRAKNAEQSLLRPPDPPRGLFSDQDGIGPALLPSETDLNARENERASLIERAGSGDKSVLKEAQSLGDQKFYNEVLDQLITNANRATTLVALVSFVTRNELPVSSKLAEAVIKSWRNSPDRSSTATALHLAALADDAALYQSTVETALDFWRRGSLPTVSATELRALFDGEFWVLSAQTRSSGTGFVLKRTLANARRELETAMRVN
jgi:hypothetical protein